VLRDAKVAHVPQKRIIKQTGTTNLKASFTARCTSPPEGALHEFEKYKKEQLIIRIDRNLNAQWQERMHTSAA
jgi:hypothetical protein